jgi:hypothetical protein
MFFKRRSYIELAKKKVLLPIYWDFKAIYRLTIYTENDIASGTRIE